MCVCVCVGCDSSGGRVPLGADGRDGVRERHGRDALRSAAGRAVAVRLLAQGQRRDRHGLGRVALQALQRLQPAHNGLEVRRCRPLHVRRLQSDREAPQQTCQAYHSQ